MRRLLLILTLLALWTAACADDADTDTGASSGSSTIAPTTSVAPTTTADPLRWPVDVGATALPELVIADGTSIELYRSRDGVVLDRGFVAETDHPVTHVHQASDGDVFVREIETIGEDESVERFVRYDFDAGREELDVEWIFDVAVINGVESVIVAVTSPDDAGFGGVEAWAVDDLRLVADLGLGAEAEFGVTDFHWSEAAAIGVASAWSDLTEWVGFVDADGGPVDRPSPTDDLAYNAPPYVTAATISADGTTLYWAEGPDWGFDPEKNESGPIAGPWELHGADLSDGETTLIWPLSEPVLDSTILDVHSIVALGDFILINRTTVRGTESVSLAPLVLDFTGEEPELYEFPMVGIATASAI